VLVQSASRDLFGGKTFITRAAYDAADYPTANAIADRQKPIWADPTYRVIIEKRTEEGTYEPISWEYHGEEEDNA
jgi:hypothetical protein